MITAKDFLHSDLSIALKNYHCCKHCLIKADEAFHLGDFDTAAKRMEDFQKSLEILDSLRKKKRRYEQKQELIKHMREIGTNFENVPC